MSDTHSTSKVTWLKIIFIRTEFLAFYNTIALIQCGSLVYIYIAQLSVDGASILL